GLRNLGSGFNSRRGQLVFPQSSFFLSLIRSVVLPVTISTVFTASLPQFACLYGLGHTNTFNLLSRNQVATFARERSILYPPLPSPRPKRTVNDKKEDFSCRRKRGQPPHSCV